MYKYELRERDCGKVLHRSWYFERLLNLIPEEKLVDTEIWYNGKLIWVQNPSRFYIA